MNNYPILIPLRQIVYVDEILAATNAQRILVADCYIKDVETWISKPWGWEQTVDGRTIINIDHHANDRRFYRHVSSGNLAVEYLDSNPVDPNTTVLINHTDCDSVISSALLCGLIEPRPQYSDAVIAADHTGDPDPIADLLQALDISRDYAGSLRNLRLLEDGKPLEAGADVRLEHRRTERALAAQLVDEGTFSRQGKVAFATLQLEQRISGEFLPALLSDAWVIVSGTPMSNDSGLWENKIRLGRAAPAGMSLFSIGVLEAEPHFGGRWNAGSTKRGGGSPVPPREVAMRLAVLLDRVGSGAIEGS